MNLRRTVWGIYNKTVSEKSKGVCMWGVVTPIFYVSGLYVEVAAALGQVETWFSIYANGRVGSTPLYAVR